MDPHEMLWLGVTPDQWTVLLRQLARYLAGQGDPQAPLPEQVSKQLKDRISYSVLYGQPQLSELVDWLIAGLYRPIRDGADPAQAVRRYLGDARR